MSPLTEVLLFVQLALIVCLLGYIGDRLRGIQRQLVRAVELAARAERGALVRKVHGSMYE